MDSETAGMLNDTFMGIIDQLKTANELKSFELDCMLDNAELSKQQLELRKLQLKKIRVRGALNWI